MLDTSCGSGGFLLYALDKIRNLASEYYEENTNDHYKFWHSFAENKLYGIEVEVNKNNGLWNIKRLSK